MKKIYKTGWKFMTGLTCFLLLFNSCKKDEDTTTPVTTSQPTAVANVTTYLGQSWVTLNGSVNAYNNTVIVSFEYDTSMAYSNSISAVPDTVTGSSSTLVYANLTELIPDTKYYYRIIAEGNGFDTVIGADSTFTTDVVTEPVIDFNPDITYGSLSDNDGHVYKTVQLGNMTWMAENLRTTRLNDGTVLPNLCQGPKWAIMLDPAYCRYDNDSISYGLLYNWHAVNSGKLCPAGWHVSTDDDWNNLISVIGSDTVGYKLKETGTFHWQSPNTEATNETGFTALPGGYRNNVGGTFVNAGRIGYFWSATEYNTVDADYYMLSYNFGHLDHSSAAKAAGFSVRCVKDN